MDPATIVSLLIHLMSPSSAYAQADPSPNLSGQNILEIPSMKQIARQFDQGQSQGDVASYMAPDQTSEAERRARTSMMESFGANLPPELERDASGRVISSGFHPSRFLYAHPKLADLRSKDWTPGPENNWRTIGALAKPDWAPDHPASGWEQGPIERGDRQKEDDRFLQELFNAVRAGGKPSN